MPESTGRKVVVGIDGADDCENAIRWGAAEAAARGVGLHLVHAFVWAEFRVPLGPSGGAPGLRAAADAIVAEALDLAHKFEPGVSVTAGRIDGFPSPVLLPESRNAGVISIGSREAGRVLGLLVGSTGLKLAAHAHCPVVVVRPGEEALVGSRVVIGYDGSPAATPARVRHRLRAAARARRPDCHGPAEGRGRRPHRGAAGPRGRPGGRGRPGDRPSR